MRVFSSGPQASILLQFGFRICLGPNTSQRASYEALGNVLQSLASLPACLPPMPFSLPPFSCLSLALFLFALSLPLSPPSLPPVLSHVSLVSPYFPFFLTVFPPPSFRNNLSFFSLSVDILYPFLLSQSSPLFYLPYLPWVVFPHLSTYLSPYLPLS